jgi:hypothetical protein
MKYFLVPLVLCFLFLGKQCFSQGKHALLIAINQYEPPGGVPKGSEAGLRSGFSNLDGCINDAQAIKTLLLSRFGFSASNITEVFNQDATRKRMMDEVASLTARVKEGDVVFIFYAGHGSQQPNSLSPEYDKLDETLVPADAWKNPLSDIRDKEQRLWYNGLLAKGVNLTVIFDCCHSGSMSRGGEPVYSRPKFRKIEQNPNDAKDASLPPAPETIAGDRLLVISAAQDVELAAEATDAYGLPHGAFTMAFMTAIGQSPTSVSAGNLFTAIRNILKSNGVAQEPQIIGTDNRLKQNLLGISSGELTNKTIVSLRRNAVGKGWEISAGSGLGLRKGNEFSLIGNNSVTIKIDSIFGVASASVKLLKGNEKELEPGRFFELTNWVSEEKPLLTVYVPENPFDYKGVQQIAAQVIDLQKATPGKWVENLKAVVPDVSAWYFRGKLQMQVKGELLNLANWKQLEDVVAKPDIKSAIFFLPVPVELKQSLLKYFLPGTSYQMTNDPALAQYHVSGQVDKAGQTVYYLMNRASASKDSLEALPNETNRHAMTSTEPSQIDQLSNKLFDYAVRIGRVRGWLQVSGPGNNDFPFELVVVDAKGNMPGNDGLKLGGEAMLKMVATEQINNPLIEIKDKYVYAFAIDKDGAMGLLYPDKGSGEKFPKRGADGVIIPEYLLGEFDVVEPAGIDNFFVLAVKDPIPNPQSIFNQEGVFTSRNASLKGLLDPLINMGTRSVKLGRTETGNDWNLLRLAVKSVR